MERLAREHKPKMIIAGASAYALRIDFERFARVAKEVGAIFMGGHGALRRPRLPPVSTPTRCRMPMW
jgi:hypothetical protein